MKCPTCPDSILIITDKKGVEIDFVRVVGGCGLTAASWTNSLRFPMTTMRRANKPRKTGQTLSTQTTGACKAGKPIHSADANLGLTIFLTEAHWQIAGASRARVNER